MKVISVASAKGGVGKSTLAVNLACTICEAGHSVSVLDMDPQGSAVLWGELRSNRAGTATPPNVIATTPETLIQNLRALVVQKVDYAILDMPGWSSTTLDNVLRSCQLVVVPSRASIIDIAPASATIEAAMRLGKTFCYVMNFVPEDRTMFRAVKEQLENAGLLVSPVALPESGAFPRAFMNGKAVIEFEPDGKAAKEVRWLWRYLEGLL